MEPKENLTRPGTAEVLAALSQVSMRQGDLALARVRLQEALGAITVDPSPHVGASALHAVAAFAESIGQLDSAVEFYSAHVVILSPPNTPDSDSSQELGRTLARLKSQIGRQRYEASWSAPRTTSFPLESYVARARQWLESLPPLDGSEPPPGPDDIPDSEAPGTTAALLSRAKEGSDTARGKLAGRYMEPLRQFGHGRLPDHARDLMDTDDLVQVTVAKGLQRIKQIEARRKGSFFAYLRQILLNLVRDEVRRVTRKPRPLPLSDSTPSAAPSPLQETLGQEVFASYHQALAKLPARQRAAVELRVEHGLSYQEIAESTDCPTANAARMLVERGLKRVTQHMRKM